MPGLSRTRPVYMQTARGAREAIHVMRFRLSVSPLFVDEGRSRKLPRAERLCRFCDSAEIENLEHVAVCPFFSRHVTVFKQSIVALLPQVDMAQPVIFARAFRFSFDVPEQFMPYDLCKRVLAAINKFVIDAKLYNVVERH